MAWGREVSGFLFKHELETCSDRSRTSVMSVGQKGQSGQRKGYLSVGLSRVDTRGMMSGARGRLAQGESASLTRKRPQVQIL